METGISKNINNLGSSSGCTSTSNTFIAGYNDWLNLQYWGTSANYAEGTTINATIPGNVTIPANVTIPGNVTFPANVTIPGNVTIPANVTSIGIPFDTREGLDEKNVDNFVASRVSLLESIDNYIRSFPDEDFRNPMCKNVLIGNMDQIRPHLNPGPPSGGPPEAMNRLIAIRNQMDSSSNGNPADDCLTNAEAQGVVVPQIDNFIRALDKQR
jgi:hypothetical protein